MNQHSPGRSIHTPLQTISVSQLWHPAIAYTICWCVGVSLAVVDEEDMQPLGTDQLFDASYCTQLLTHTTTMEKTHRPPSRS